MQQDELRCSSCYNRYITYTPHQALEDELRCSSCYRYRYARYARHARHIRYTPARH